MPVLLSTRVPAAQLGAWPGFFFKPFCPAQASRALACTGTIPGTGRRGAPPAGTAQVIQKRDGQGGPKKSQHLAKTQPPLAGTWWGAEGLCATPALPASGEQRWAGVGGEAGPGRPAPAARPGPPGTAAGASAPPKRTRVSSPGRYRPKPGEPPAQEAAVSGRREPGTPRPGCSTERAPRSHRAESRERSAAGSPSDSDRSSGKLLLRRAVRRRPGRGRVVAPLPAAAFGLVRPATSTSRCGETPPSPGPAVRAAAGGRLPGDEAAPPPRQGWAMR